MAQRYSQIETREPSGAHYARAWALYARGPETAESALSELDLELSENPGSISARVLKAWTLKGTDRCPEALAALDDAERILEARDEIAGSAKLVRAECLFYAGHAEESKRLLTAYSAFIRQSPSSIRKYDELLAKVEKRLAP
jgi:predicted Zn-dependent protease